MVVSRCVEWGMVQANRRGEVWESGWVDDPLPISRQEKKIGGSIQLPWCPPFSSLHLSPTESNPDMRKSKLAHIQAGF